MEISKVVELIGKFTKEDVQFLKAAKEGVLVVEIDNPEPLKKFAKFGIIQLSDMSHPLTVRLTPKVITLTDTGQRLVNAILQESVENDIAGKAAPGPFVSNKFRDEFVKKQTEVLGHLEGVQRGQSPLDGRIKEIADLDKPMKEEDIHPTDPEVDNSEHEYPNVKKNEKNKKKQ